MENHAYAQITGNPAAPFINTLARRGALFTRSYAITHLSEPNLPDHILRRHAGRRR